MEIIKFLLVFCVIAVIVEPKCTKLTTCAKKTTCAQKTTCHKPTVTQDNDLLVEYVVNVDAGTSGTRFYLYDIRKMLDYEFTKPEILNKVELLKCTADGDSLDNIRSQAELDSNFEKCLNQIKSMVPSEKYKVTKINLYATAGMRLLSIRNEQQAMEIIEYVRESFKNSGLLYDRNQNLILNGYAEGQSANLQANILYDNMNATLNNWTSIGLMDLGAGSSQISYQPIVSGNKTRDFYLNLTKQKDLTESKEWAAVCPAVPYYYTTSELCYGQEEFRYIYQASLIAKHVLAGQSGYEISAACYPKNSTTALNPDFYDSICTMWQLAPASLKNNQEFLGKYVFIGQGDSKKCQDEIKPLMYQRKCDGDDCTYLGEYQGQIKNLTFKAINGFYFAIDNLKRLTNKTDDFTMSEFESETDRLCNFTLDALEILNNRNNNGSLEEAFIKRQCFLANYVKLILENRGFTSLENIEFVYKKNNVQLNWTLGIAWSIGQHELTNGWLVPPRLVEIFRYDPKDEKSKALVGVVMDQVKI